MGLADENSPYGANRNILSRLPTVVGIHPLIERDLKNNMF